MAFATTDPRAAGFNYGAPIAEPTDPWYQAVKTHAEHARRRNSDKGREYSWDLDMLIKAVRCSCSVDEQNRKLVHLRRYLKLETA